MAPGISWDWLSDLHIPAWFLVVAGGLLWSFGRLKKDLKGIGKKLGIFQDKTRNDISKLNAVVTGLAISTGNKDLLQFLAQEQPQHPTDTEGN